jgi:hypothetical protein
VQRRVRVPLVPLLCFSSCNVTEVVVCFSALRRADFAWRTLEGSPPPTCSGRDLFFCVLFSNSARSPSKSNGDFGVHKKKKKSEEQQRKTVKQKSRKYTQPNGVCWSHAAKQKSRRSCRRSSIATSYHYKGQCSVHRSPQDTSALDLRADRNSKKKKKRTPSPPYHL